MSKKRSSVFQEKINRGDTAEVTTKKEVARFFRKNRGVTPSVAATGVTHPSDATVYAITKVSVEKVIWMTEENYCCE